MLIIKTYTALSGFAALSSAHMLLAQPKPFAGTTNGPLDATGINFPCQMSSSGGVSTTLALGSMQPLAFIGQAVHGGGSCQVSITYDTNPTKQSVWKVLHSIQGGCPATGQSGNMGSDASAADPFTYQYPIPSNIPAGQATLAWSWLNRIGNREFYMNCASITLTGTGGPKSNWEALPDMVVANIPSINSCTTTELKDYTFTNPGASVENHPFAVGVVQLLDNCGIAGTNSSTGGSGSGSAPTTSAAAKPTSTTVAGGVFITVATSAAANPTPTTVAGGVFATISAGSSSGGAATTPVSSATATATAVASSAKPTTSASSGSSGSSSGSTVGAQTVGAACTDGAWACVGGTSYQRCGSGAWSVVMPLASGTKCTGASANSIEIIASGKVKRVARRFRS